MSVAEQDTQPDTYRQGRGERPHRFIFVGGSARSGTTLIQKMLCAHTKICGGPEFDHAVPAMQLFERMSSELQLERQQFYYSRDELTDIFREFYASLFDGLAARNPGIAYISEKTPANIAAAASLLKLFPSAFYVNVVRDGRDVVLSHQKVLRRFKQQHGRKGRRWWKEYCVREVSRKWNHDIAAYQALLADPSVADRVMNVRYEDVIRRPAETIQPIFERLGLSLEEQILRPDTVDKSQLGYNVNVDGVWYTDEMFHQKLNDLSVSGWKAHLSTGQKLLANLLQCRNLDLMGYDIAPGFLRVRRWIDRIRGRRS